MDFGNFVAEEETWKKVEDGNFVCFLFTKDFSLFLFCFCKIHNHKSHLLQAHSRPQLWTKYTQFWLLFHSKLCQIDHTFLMLANLQFGNYFVNNLLQRTLDEFDVGMNVGYKKREMRACNCQLSADWNNFSFISFRTKAFNPNNYCKCQCHMFL